MSSFPPPQMPDSYASSAPQPCGNGIRFGAFLLEAVLTLVTCGIGWLIWAIVLWQQSTTPAKKMLKMRIVDVQTGAPAVMQQMLMRELAGKIALPLVLNLVSASIIANDQVGLGSLVFIVSGVMILTNQMRQGLWDVMAKTTVVRDL